VIATSEIQSARMASALGRPSSCPSKEPGPQNSELVSPALQPQASTKAEAPLFSIQPPVVPKELSERPEAVSPGDFQDKSPRDNLAATLASAVSVQPALDLSLSSKRLERPESTELEEQQEVLMSQLSKRKRTGDEDATFQAMMRLIDQNIILKQELACSRMEVRGLEAHSHE